MNFGVVILAAGASQRMGRSKLMLRWRDTTVLGHIRKTWEDLGSRQTCVVHSASDATILSELDRLNHPNGNRIPNPSPEAGMFGSIQCAARWRGWDPDITHWLITLGDQPQIRWDTLKALIEHAYVQPNQICQPALDGRPKHPVFLPAPIFRGLADTDATDFMTCLAAHHDQTALLTASDPGLDFDLDTPADYQEALRRFTDA